MVPLFGRIPVRNFTPWINLKKAHKEPKKERDGKRGSIRKAYEYGRNGTSGLKHDSAI